VSAARATAHEPIAQASSSLTALTVTAPLWLSAETPKSLSSSATSASASPAVSGASSAQPMPAFVWPERTDAVTRACASCCAYASPAADRCTFWAASAMSIDA
jgi:hypothetical protein